MQIYIIQNSIHSELTANFIFVENCSYMKKLAQEHYEYEKVRQIQNGEVSRIKLLTWVLT